MWNTLLGGATLVHLWVHERWQIVSFGSRWGRPYTEQSWQRRTPPPRLCCPTGTSPEGMMTASTVTHIWCQSRTQATPLMHSGRAEPPGGCTPPQSGQRTGSARPWSAHTQSSRPPVQSEQSRTRRRQHSRLWQRNGKTRSCWPELQIWCRPQSPEPLWASQRQWPCSPPQPGPAWPCTRPPQPRRPQYLEWSRRWQRCGNFGHHSQRRGSQIGQRRVGRRQRLSHTYRRRLSNMRGRFAREKQALCHSEDDAGIGSK